jgi:mannosylglycoprotein endo-beta-mannosidase
LGILVNDAPTEYFHPQRGLRQVCPLSPYLFVIAINELSIRLQEALHNNNLSGISLGLGALPLHSLLFADDLILCGKATLEEAYAIKTILYDFCQQSSQIPNLKKSSIYFSRHVSN